MQKRISFLILLFLSSLILLSFFSGCLSITPETVVTGTIYGYVAIPDDTSKDLTGYSPIPGATVTIVDADGVTHTVITDEDGSYCFNNISVNVNTIINIEKEIEDGGKLIFKDIVPLAVSLEEDYDAGIADAVSTATALVVEELVDLGQVQEEIGLDEITSSDGFDELKEDVEQAQEDNQDINTDPINTQAEEIADNIVNPPPTTPEPEPTPSPPAPTPATADLSGLALSGSPSNYTFASSTYTYNSVTVANAITSITVTPTGAGTITVEGTTVTSGSPSGAIALTAGVEKTITIVATETGKTAKTYTIKVTRAAPSTATDISTYKFEAAKNVALSSDVTGTVDSGAHIVALNVPYGTTVTALVATFTLSDGATAKVGGISQVSGTTANDFTNPVTYTITAQDGSTTQGWTVTVTNLRATGPAGGLIFYDNGSYIAATETVPSWRYLEAAPSDQSTGAPWGCCDTEISGADGILVGTGEQNTIDILAGCATSGIAARLCDDYSTTVSEVTYSDWFLPSKDELNKMWVNLKKGTDENGATYEPVGGFADNFYWSSSEDSALYAWDQEFLSGGQGLLYYKKGMGRVRAVRAF